MLKLNILALLKAALFRILACFQTTHIQNYVRFEQTINEKLPRKKSLSTSNFVRETAKWPDGSYTYKS